LEVLQWARANSCDWNAETCLNAAESGHLNVLQWARMNGCEWNEKRCARFAEDKHYTKMLQWINTQLQSADG
jgi:hypothetical protein